MKAIGTVAGSILLVFAAGLYGANARESSAMVQEVTQSAAKYPKHVLIIRHAEKTGEEADTHLSKQGHARAAVLHELFVKSNERADPFPTPDFLFAASTSKNSSRPVETIAELAKKLNLPINQQYDSKALPPVKKDAKDNSAKIEGWFALRDTIFGDSKYFGKTILISWRHNTISELAKALRATKVPASWHDDVFDRVWQISYDEQGRTTFLDLPQRLLPSDRSDRRLRAVTAE